MLCAQAGGLNDAKSPFEVAPGVRFAGPGDQDDRQVNPFQSTYLVPFTYRSNCAHYRGVPNKFSQADMFQFGYIPLLTKGWRGINQKSRSHRRAADGVVAHATRFTNAFRSIV